MTFCCMAGGGVWEDERKPVGKSPFEMEAQSSSDRCVIE